MTLIKSISGIRGTIGGKAGEGLNPTDVIKYTAAYGTWLKARNSSDKKKLKVVIGRDARISGEMVSNFVTGTLQSIGIDVMDIGVSTTPTVEVAVDMEKTAGGIIITASHNPKEWNALKLLNEKGEFISAEDGQEILEIAEKGDFTYVEVDDIGIHDEYGPYFLRHSDLILNLDLVDVEAIKRMNFKIVIDCVNSSGSLVIPPLLKALGVERDNIIDMYGNVDGNFPHNPEPLPENLTAIAKRVVAEKADFGLVVDPDVDRLAIVCENGEMFGEEYTLVAVADYVLSQKKGNTVSNLSSSRALRDVTEKWGGEYFASAVGEVNVVSKMKEVKAVIGGEGNGGVIFPEIHYGRDALIGIALFTTHLAKTGWKCSALRASYPNYFISKNKIALSPEINVDEILKAVEQKYKEQPINTIDGLKIEFDKEWVHLRKSNTEPIIRIYSESSSEDNANKLAKKMMDDIKEMISSNQLA